MKFSARSCLTLIACIIFALPALAEDAPYSDPSKTITAELCQDFSIILESNKTTGFGWDIAVPIDETILAFVSCEYIAADTGVVGSGGREIWTFRAMYPGKASISFKYVRPWEEDVPPAKEMEFTVCVQETPIDRNNQEDPCSDQR